MADTISHYEIAKFWFGKRFSDVTDIDPKYDDYIVEWEYDPHCWGCGRDIYKTEPVPQDGETDEMFGRRVWNSKLVAQHLNKCHIVPKMLGGEATPDNMFLLCEGCHLESPDTTNRAAFFRYIAKRRKDFLFGKVAPQITLQEVNTELKDRGMPTIEEMAIRIGTVNPSFQMPKGAFHDFAMEHLGIHAGKAAHSSIVVAFADYLIDCYKKAGCI